MHSEELHKLYTSLDTIKEIKVRKMRGQGT